MNEADSIYPNAAEFAKRLRKLRHQRLAGKNNSDAEKKSRHSLTATERNTVLQKTGGRCHICGGEILDRWAADHILAHINGGAHSIDNFLPAHVMCNAAKWFYGMEEFQWILKMGVYFRTQLEEQSNPDAVALAEKFMEHERTRNARRKSPLPISSNEN